MLCWGQGRPTGGHGWQAGGGGVALQQGRGAKCSTFLSQLVQATSRRGAGGSVTPQLKCGRPVAYF